MKFHICTVRPPGFIHVDGFREIIDSLSWALSVLGHQAVIADNSFSPDGVNIVFGAELLGDQAVPENAILYNLEQPGHGGMANVARLGKTHQTWDYNLGNVEEWKKQGFDAHYVPFGYTPNLVRIPKLDKKEQDIDVFFSGWITPRRQHIINELRSCGLKVVAVDTCYGGGRDHLISRAKVCLNVNHDGRTLFNIQRVSFWLANHKCVVSEISSNDADYADLDKAIVRVPYEEIVHACHELVTKKFNPFAHSYQTYENLAHHTFKARDYVATVKAALEKIPSNMAIKARYERGCREGDMKDFLPFLRENSKGNILEIGVRDGASTSAFLLGLEKNGGHLYSLDIADCSHLWNHPQWTFTKASSQLAPALKFPDMDMALIDGDHSRTGFMKDLIICRAMVKRGGLILCHDIHPEKSFEDYAGDFPSVAVGEEYFKFAKENGLTHFELPGTNGLGAIVND